MDYIKLKQEVVRENLLAPTISYYIIKISLLLLFLTLCFWFTFIVKNVFLFIIASLALGFFAVQAGLLAHDAGHRAITKKPWLTNILGYVFMTLITGISFSYWNDRHNRHHVRPNHETMDPDVVEQAMAFTKKQVLKRKKVARFITKHQAILFIPIYLLTAFGLRFEGIKHLKKLEGIVLAREIFFLFLHVTVWLMLPLLFLTILKTLFLYAISSLTLGIYFTLVFVPNHWGMPIITEEEKKSFLEEQLLTSRNIKSNWVVDYLMGGLNYQIEHHLFPSISRKNLRKVKQIVQSYCEKEKLPYQEQNYFQSLKDIFIFLHKVSTEARLVLI